MVERGKHVALTQSCGIALLATRHYLSLHLSHETEQLMCATRFCNGREHHSARTQQRVLQAQHACKPVRARNGPIQTGVFSEHTAREQETASTWWGGHKLLREDQRLVKVYQ